MTPSSNSHMLLILEPKEELRFYGQYDSAHPPQSHIKVTNPTPYCIYFKMKATAATRYWVSPKMGFLLPYSHKDIVIGMRLPKGDSQDRFKLLAMVSNNGGQKSQNGYAEFEESQAMVNKWVVVFRDEPDGHMLSVPHADPTDKPCHTSTAAETIPSLAKILTFITVGFVAVLSSLYRLGASTE